MVSTRPGPPIPEILNHTVNFGWEYVWHCHILSHEEMDMMHSLVVAVPRGCRWASVISVERGESHSELDRQFHKGGAVPDREGDGRQFHYGTGGHSPLPNPPLTGPVTYVDKPPVDQQYWYRVISEGYPVATRKRIPFHRLPTMTRTRLLSQRSGLVGILPGTPATPTNLARALQAGPAVRLTWRDNANNETGFLVDRCTGVGCANFAQIAVAPPRNGPATRRT